MLRKKYTLKCGRFFSHECIGLRTSYFPATPAPNHTRASQREEKQAAPAGAPAANTWNYTETPCGGKAWRSQDRRARARPGHCVPQSSLLARAVGSTAGRQGTSGKELVWQMTNRDTVHTAPASGSNLPLNTRPITEQNDAGCLLAPPCLVYTKQSLGLQNLLPSFRHNHTVPITIISVMKLRTQVGEKVYMLLHKKCCHSPF